MVQPPDIHPMADEEAEPASALVRAAIHSAFPACYSVEVVEAVAAANTAEFLRGLAPQQTNYVLAEDGAIVGVTGLKRNEIGHLFVHPNHFGRGIGRRLVAFAAERFREAGHADMIVCSSLNAEGFYARCGFRREGEGSFEVAPGLPLHYIRMRCPLAGA